MQSDPLVSVVIPAFNSAETIPRSLDAVLRQSYRNIELVVVDDGSTDDTASTVERYCALDDRVRLLRQENGGVGAARNTGLRVSTGKYVFFVDADDSVSELSIEACVRISESNGASISIIETNAKDVATDLERTYGSELSIEAALCDISVSVWGKLILRSLFTDNGVSFPHLRGGEDLAVVPLLLCLSSSVFFVHGVTYFYKYGRLSSSRAMMVASRADALRYLIADFDKRGLLAARKDELCFITYLHGLEFQIPTRFGNSPSVWHRAKTATRLIYRAFPEFYTNPRVIARNNTTVGIVWLRLCSASPWAIHARFYLDTLRATLRRLVRSGRPA